MFELDRLTLVFRALQGKQAVLDLPNFLALRLGVEASSAV
jgi:hypothetical protein